MVSLMRMSFFSRVVKNQFYSSVNIILRRIKMFDKLRNSKFPFGIVLLGVGGLAIVCFMVYVLWPMNGHVIREPYRSAIFKEVEEAEPQILVMDKFEVLCRDVIVKADITYFWSDTHSTRDDMLDEKLCMQIKFWYAVTLAFREDNINRENISGNVYTTMATIFKHFKDGEKTGDRNWAILKLKSVTYRYTQDITITQEFASGRLENPYYADHECMRFHPFPE